MRKRVITVVMACLVGAAVYGIYYISPFGRHDRQAAALEYSTRAGVLRVEGTRVIHESAHVTSSPGNGGNCWLEAILEVSTPLTAQAFEQRLQAVLDVDTYTKITQVGERDSGSLLRVETAALGEGGTLDLRCG